MRKFITDLTNNKFKNDSAIVHKIVGKNNNYNYEDLSEHFKKYKHVTSDLKINIKEDFKNVITNDPGARITCVTQIISKENGDLSEGEKVFMQDVVKKTQESYSTFVRSHNYKHGELTYLDCRSASNMDKVTDLVQKYKTLDTNTPVIEESEDWVNLYKEFVSQFSSSQGVFINNLLFLSGFAEPLAFYASEHHVFAAIGVKSSLCLFYHLHQPGIFNSIMQDVSLHVKSQNPVYSITSKIYAHRYQLGLSVATVTFGVFCKSYFTSEVSKLSPYAFSGPIGDYVKSTQEVITKSGWTLGKAVASFNSSFYNGMISAWLENSKDNRENISKIWGDLLKKK
jgi:hypothetical protein